MVQSDPSTYGLPVVFFKDQGVSATEGGGINLGFGVRPEVKVGGFPVIFDREMDYERVGTVVNELIKSGYVDEYTKEIKMELILYNSKIDLFSQIVVTGTNSLDATGMNLESTVSVLDLIVYDWEEDHVRIILEAVYYLSLFGLLLREVSERSDR